MARKNKKLHPFEFVGAHKLYEEERFLLADEMGMFKTAQAIFANNKFRQRNRGMRTLIVCPTSVREHWARELQEWAYPKGDINLVYAENIDDGIRNIKDATWTIMSYPLMSMTRMDNGLLRKMKRSGFHHVIADEVHNAKNPSALRTRSLKTLADKADYVSLLSGTPIPNTMSDLYVLMSLLDPEQYPFNPEKNVSDAHNLRIARQGFIQLYKARPEAVKELLHRKMLRRGIEDYLSAQVPELEVHRVEIPLSGRHLEVYQEVLGQDMNAGKKIMDLAKASLDPCLIDDSLPRVRRNGRDISVKYDALDEIVEREMSKRNGKVLIFSNLKKGIIDYLLDSYQDLGAIKITGDVTTYGGVRERLRQQFQRDPNTRVLLATTTMNEGVDLTAATAVVELTVPLTPAERHQRWKRSHRPGEVKKDKVDVYSLYTTIPGPQPSLDQALLEMVDGKEEIVSYLLKGMQVSLEELRTYDETKKVPNIIYAITSPNKAIFEYFKRWRGIGGKNAVRRRQRNPEISKHIAELYPDFIMARNAADIYIPIIRDLEKRRDLSVKIDIGSGPGMLGYFLDEPTIGVDISPDMIRTGKNLYPGNNLVVGNMGALPLEDRLAGIGVCSLAFQMTEPKKERAQSLQEMSRILKHRGYMIITIPGKYMNSRDKRRFGEVAGDYGFTIKDYQREIGKSKMDVYVLQKTHSSTTDRVYSLKWKGDPKRK